MLSTLTIADVVYMLSTVTAVEEVENLGIADQGQVKEEKRDDGPWRGTDSTHGGYSSHHGHCDRSTAEPGFLYPGHDSATTPSDKPRRFSTCYTRLARRAVELARAPCITSRFARQATSSSWHGETTSSAADTT